MKELTIEEKAKAYDDAIRKAREWSETKNGYYTPKELCEEIFSELKEENEDEKVKQRIIKLIKMSNEVGGFALHKWEADEMLAWLEKQGEQKSAEWSEEDESHIRYLIECLEHCKKGVALTMTTSTAQEYISWLKSLRPQKQQKWSKQDIEMIDWLIRCCEKEHEELCNDKCGHQEIVSDLKRDCRKKWDWLESLKDKVVPQKQWKPSEEQMVTLEYYMHTLVCNSYKETLFSLYHDLKKLREE